MSLWKSATAPRILLTRPTCVLAKVATAWKPKPHLPLAWCGTGPAYQALSPGDAAWGRTGIRRIFWGAGVDYMPRCIVPADRSRPTPATERRRAGLYWRAGPVARSRSEDGAWSAKKCTKLSPKRRGADPVVTKASQQSSGVICRSTSGKESIPVVRAGWRQRPLWPSCVHWRSGSLRSTAAVQRAACRSQRTTAIG